VSGAEETIQNQLRVFVSLSCNQTRRVYFLLSVSARVIGNLFFRYFGLAGMGLLPQQNKMPLRKPCFSVFPFPINLASFSMRKWSWGETPIDVKKIV
jgi:hypothetical protein